MPMATGGMSANSELIPSIRPEGTMISECCSRICSCRKPPSSKAFNTPQQARRICLKQTQLKMNNLLGPPESALGAAGRAFKSPRPDHPNQRRRRGKLGPDN